MIFISCDMEVGTNGIVVDSVTGERIENVAVKMRSQEQGDKNDITDSVGYFNVFRAFSCGIASCNTNYKISFTKEGYVSREIDENFESSPEAEIIEGFTDSLVIKLVPVDAE